MFGESGESVESEVMHGWSRALATLRMLSPNKNGRLSAKTERQSNNGQSCGILFLTTGSVSVNSVIVEVVGPLKKNVMAFGELDGALMCFSEAVAQPERHTGFLLSLI